MAPLGWLGFPVSRIVVVLHGKTDRRKYSPLAVPNRIPCDSELVIRTVDCGLRPQQRVAAAISTVTVRGVAMPWPETTARISGTMTIRRRICVELAREFGTPLYVFDAVTLDKRSQGIRTLFLTSMRRPGLCRQGVSGHPGDSDRACGFGSMLSPRASCRLRPGSIQSDMIFHGNNKSRAELRR